MFAAIRITNEWVNVVRFKSVCVGHTISNHLQVVRLLQLFQQRFDWMGLPSTRVKISNPLRQIRLDCIFCFVPGNVFILWHRKSFILIPWIHPIFYTMCSRIRKINTWHISRVLWFVRINNARVQWFTSHWKIASDYLCHNLAVGILYFIIYFNIFSLFCSAFHSLHRRKTTGTNNLLQSSLMWLHML